MLALAFTPLTSAGTCGLSTLKTLREDGYKVTGFERRERVGGLWAYTDNTSMTSALKSQSSRR
jgi:dimethylaniline monooxygenase (N-oxide forming)